MSTSKTSQDNSDIDKALAILIANTRTQKRSISLVEIASALDVGIRQLGSISAVADRISLSPDMLRLFLSVSKLMPSVKAKFASRELDSVDAATQLSRVPSVDQVEAAIALANRAIDTGDVRALRQLRRIRPEATTSELLESVCQSKTKRHYIAEFVVRGHPSLEKVRSAIQRFINAENIVDIGIEGAMARVTLKAAGRKQLSDAAKILKTSLADAFTEILANR